MIEINLIPSVKRDLLRARSIRNRVVSVSFLVGSASVAAVVALAVIFGGQIAAEAVQKGSIKDKGNKLSSITDLNKVVTIQNQLSKITSQHDSKKINSRVFDVVSAVNPPAPNDISFSTVKLDPESKTITLEGTAANGYSALETLKKTILKTKIKVTGDKSSEVSLAESVQDGNTSFGENSEGKKVLQFSFSFNYPDELLGVSRDGSVSIVTPTSKVDVTDSRQSIPDSLFKKEATKKSSDKENK